MGIMSLIVGIYLAGQALDFHSRAVKIDAVVVGHVENPYSDGDDDSPTYSPIFQFTDLDGDNVRRQGALSYSDHLQFEIGTTVEILYDPENPSGRVYAGILELLFWPIISSLGGLAFILAGYFLNRRWKNSEKTRI
jgi:hypothetical protein